GEPPKGDEGTRDGDACPRDGAFNLEGGNHKCRADRPRSLRGLERQFARLRPCQQQFAPFHVRRELAGEQLAVNCLPLLLLIRQHRTGEELTGRQNVVDSGRKVPVRGDWGSAEVTARRRNQRISRVAKRPGFEPSLKSGGPEPSRRAKPF